MIMCFADQHFEGYILHPSAQPFHNLQAPSSINRGVHDATCKQEPHLKTLATESSFTHASSIGSGNCNPDGK